VAANGMERYLPVSHMVLLVHMGTPLLFVIDVGHKSCIAKCKSMLNSATAYNLKLNKLMVLKHSQWQQLRQSSKIHHLLQQDLLQLQPQPCHFQVQPQL